MTQATGLGEWFVSSSYLSSKYSKRLVYRILNIAALTTYRRQADGGMNSVAMLLGSCTITTPHPRLRNSHNRRPSVLFGHRWLCALFGDDFSPKICWDETSSSEREDHCWLRSFPRVSSLSDSWFEDCLNPETFAATYNQISHKNCVWPAVAY